MAPKKTHLVLGKLYAFEKVKFYYLLIVEVTDLAACTSVKALSSFSCNVVIVKTV